MVPTSKNNINLYIPLGQLPEDGKQIVNNPELFFSPKIGMGWGVGVRH